MCLPLLITLCLGIAGFGADETLRDLERRLTVTADYLVLPLINIESRGRAERFTVVDDNGKVLRADHFRFAAPEQKPDVLYSYDLREFRGREVILRFRSTDHEALIRLELSDHEIIKSDVYREEHRPRFHYSTRTGLMSDINGPFYLDGLYHTFYQLVPTDANWVAAHRIRHKHWGHAVSKDLVHWEQRPIALFPDHWGGCFSGSAIVLDRVIKGVNENCALPSPVLFYTAFPANVQMMVVSPDKGKTWKRHPANPVLSAPTRDPKVFHHKPTGNFIMLLSLIDDGDERGYVIYRSEDLLEWERVGIIPNWFECADVFTLTSAVTGREVWVMYGAYYSYHPRSKPGPNDFSFRSAYQIFDFDGTNFTPLTDVRAAHSGSQFYAAQHFVNAPNQRRIMMGWAAGAKTPQGHDFTECSTLPLELTLKNFGGQDVLCFEPVPEVDSLRGAPVLNMKNVGFAQAEEKLRLLSKEGGWDVVLRVNSGKNPFTVTIRDLEWTFNPEENLLTGPRRATRNYPETHGIIDKELHPESNCISARFLIDRLLVESFWNSGEAAFAFHSMHTDQGPAFSITGDGIIEEIVVYPMKDIWER